MQSLESRLVAAQNKDALSPRKMQVNQPLIVGSWPLMSHPSCYEAWREANPRFRCIHIRTEMMI
eukprot:c9711_g2_i1 orf=135-326(-)